MAKSVSNPPPLPELVDRIVASYRAEPRIQHLDAAFLPNRARTIQIIELLRRLVFPGFFDEARLNSAIVHYHVGELLIDVHDLLYEQIRETLCYQANGGGEHAAPPGCPAPEPCPGAAGGCDLEARRLTGAFLARLPEVRRMLALDVQASFDGDPAASNTDETIFCYPGVTAIFVHRVAHELWRLGIPLLPRIMSEYAHAQTGIDIHPGAQIGESFFIDHGTGVVIGETCIIGKRVKLYQGVTLGALSTKGGQDWRGRKRHPTIEDDVTIYGGAIILGGETVIGQGCTIGGSVFITSSVPAGHSVTMKSPELKVNPRHPRNSRAARASSAAPEDAARPDLSRHLSELPPIDFQI